MIRFNITGYPKFYQVFRDAIGKDPEYLRQSIISSTFVELFLKREYDLTVSVPHGSTLWEVLIDEQEFTVFLLKWS